MTEIDTLEGRIIAALDRIRRRVDAADDRTAAAEYPVEAPAAPPELVAALNTQLDDERIANAQLEERVRVLKERQDSKLGTLEAMLEKQRAHMVALDQELGRLRQINSQLRGINSQLRDALSDGDAAPDLLNEAMKTELAALRANRAADVAELDAVIDELRPLIEEAR